MRIIDSKEIKETAGVFIADMGGGKTIEFAEAFYPDEARWVILISTLFGCPVGCKMCDAGSSDLFKGALSKEEIIDQIDFLVSRKSEKERRTFKQFKIQFARMGEPAFNNNVLDVLREIKTRYSFTKVMPSVSTIAPEGREDFFKEIIKIKNNFYSDGNFQMQFSIHTTDEKKRDWLIPINKWSFNKISDFADSYLEKGDLKITLNFALAENMPLDASVLKKYFSPEKFLIKITPLNPTYQAIENKLSSYIIKKSGSKEESLVNSIREAGYDVILSIGNTEENFIGSNCGQYVSRHLKKTADKDTDKGYIYWK